MDGNGSIESKTPDGFPTPVSLLLMPPWLHSFLFPQAGIRYPGLEGGGRFGFLIGHLYCENAGTVPKPSEGFPRVLYPGDAFLLGAPRDGMSFVALSAAENFTVCWEDGVCAGR